MAETNNKQIINRDEFWRQHLVACRRRGLSYAEYCRQNDLTESAFGYWRRQLSSPRTGRPGFVELRVCPGGTNGIQVTLRNRISLTIGEDFDEGVLSKLVRVLESV